MAMLRSHAAQKSGVRGLISDKSGGLTINLALMLPVVLWLAGFGIDRLRFMHSTDHLQHAVDAAALAAAKELSLASSSQENMTELAQAVVKSYFDGHRRDGKTGAALVTKLSVTKDPTQVETSATMDFEPLFGNLFGISFPKIGASAVARVIGKPNVCVLALETAEPGAVALTDNAKLTGNNCAVFSNSVSQKELAVLNDATLTAQNVCTAGGYDNSGIISPAPVVDCPSFTDPLESREEPAIGPCDFNDTAIKDQTVMLKPGVYCGGLRISGMSQVSLEPGVYIIEGGALMLYDGAKMTGEGVSFYLGPTAFMFFGPPLCGEPLGQHDGSARGPAVLRFAASVEALQPHHTERKRAATCRHHLSAEELLHR